MERADNLYRQEKPAGAPIGDAGQAPTTAKARTRKRPRAFSSAASPATPSMQSIFNQSTAIDSRREQYWVLSIALVGIVAGIGLFAYNSQPSPAIEHSATVPIGGIICWSEPGLNTGIVETLPEGAPIRVIGNSNGWTQVVDKGCWAKESQLLLM